MVGPWEKSKAFMGADKEKRKTILYQKAYNDPILLMV